MVVIVSGHVDNDDDDDNDDIEVYSQLLDVSSCCSYVTLIILGKLIFSFLDRKCHPLLPM